MKGSCRLSAQKLIKEVKIAQAVASAFQKIFCHLAAGLMTTCNSALIAQPLQFIVISFLPIYNALFFMFNFPEKKTGCFT